MKVKHTIDSPILLQITPETTEEIFENGERHASMHNMKIPHRVEKDGSLIFNIDPGWKDFADDRKRKTWRESLRHEGST